jgi:hypothetical protein
MDKDLEHLKLLGIFHYIWGALACLSGLLGLAYLFIGIAVMMSPPNSSDDSTSPAVAGAILIGLGIVLFLVCEIYGIVTIIVGGKYRKHRGGYWFCFVLAIITLLSFPIGTILGIFSLIVLNRPSVKALFQGGTLPGATAVAPPA